MAYIPDDQLTPKEISSFINEAVIMKDFNHINVLSLCGVIIKEAKPYVVLPYMDKGDLKTFIKDPEQVNVTVEPGCSFTIEI